MDFEWTTRQQEVRAQVLEFARTELAASVRERGVDRPATASELRRCGERGLLGLCLAEEFGGGGHSLLTTAAALEALTLGSGDAGLSFAIGAHLFAGCVPIAEFSAAELRARVLPRLARGEWLAANAITEDGAGSDVHALAATARRDGDDYVLSGAKSFVTNAPTADLFVVYAKTAPAHGFLGISAFVVERGRPGLRVGPPLDKLGLRSAGAAPLELVDCRVPAANRIGEEGQGGPIFGRSMQVERAGLSAVWTGDMERRLSEALAHARSRRQFGKPLGKHQAVAHRLADMKLRLESGRLLWQRACWGLDRGHASALDVSLAKLAVGEAAAQSGRDVVELFGGRGYLVDFGVERHLRDAIAATIASGTSAMQRDIIARELGL